MKQTVGLVANNIGFRYYTDSGINQDYDKAASYFRISTAYGNSAGQYNLGLLYQAGKGVIKDSLEALNGLSYLLIKVTPMPNLVWLTCIDMEVVLNKTSTNALDIIR